MCWLRIVVPDSILTLKCGKGEGYARKLNEGDDTDKKDIGSTVVESCKLGVLTSSLWTGLETRALARVKQAAVNSRRCITARRASLGLDETSGACRSSKKD